MTRMELIDALTERGYRRNAMHRESTPFLEGLYAALDRPKAKCGWCNDTKPHYGGICD